MQILSLAEHAFAATSVASYRQMCHDFDFERQKKPQKL